MYISDKMYDEFKKENNTKKISINKARAAIEDAKARYIKKKTYARSKKAALEKEAVLNSPRFNCLQEFNNRDDIQEAYGWDMITQAERDRLEELWDEREEISNHVDNGYYSDEVTKLLDEASDFLFEKMDAVIDEMDVYEHIYKKQFES